MRVTLTTQKNDHLGNMLIILEVLFLIELFLSQPAFTRHRNKIQHNGVTVASRHWSHAQRSHLLLNTEMKICICKCVSTFTYFKSKPEKIEYSSKRVITTQISEVEMLSLSAIICLL